MDILKPCNHNPYVMCAIHGTGFPKSVFDAIQLTRNHERRSIAVDIMSTLVLFICETVGIFIAGVFAWILFKHFYGYIPVLAFILAILGSYVIVDIFISGSCVVVHTLFLCIRK